MLRGLFIVICFTAICISEVPAQIVFDYVECECDNTIYPEARINGEKKGVVVVYSEVDNLKFEIYNAKPERLLDVKHKDGKYILILEPIDEPFRKAYGKYDILVKAKGFQETHIYVKNVNPGAMCSFSCILRSPVDSPIDRLARITVYDKDNKVLVGAEVKEKKTGKVYGSTRYDGTIAVGFERKGETTKVIVSHPSYSDTVELTVQSGVHDYIAYLHSYNPSKGLKSPSPWLRKFKHTLEENPTIEIEAIGGTNLGLSMDLTFLYFLIGLGVDWMVFAPDQTKTIALVNSGYAGNFSKTTSMGFSGERLNIFGTIGMYFNIFSISCQVGLFRGIVNRASQYEGWGYGLVDGDLNEYWGSYEQRSFANSTSVKELHLTLTPQIKVYIPLRKDKSMNLSIGLGYTFIPSLDYYAGLSGNLGIHFRL